MSNPEAIEVRLSSEGKEKPGALPLIRFDKRARMRRAARALLFCWIGAVVSVLIPVLHFLLVPLLAVGGPFSAFMLYRQQAIIPGVMLTCPNCGADFALPRSPPNWPLFAHCAACRAFVKITAV